MALSSSALKADGIETWTFPVTTRRNKDAFKFENGLEVSFARSLGVEEWVDEGVETEDDFEKADNILEANEEVDVAAATAALLIASFDFGFEF